MVTASARSTIEHRLLGSRIVFAPDGIAFHPLARRPILVAWTEIDFVSPIPAPQEMDGGWRFKDLGLAPGWDVLRDRGLFFLDVVVHDRHALRQRFRWYALEMSPLGTAGDALDPTRGTFSIRLRVDNLDARPTEVLDLIARHARFDLLCYAD